MEKDEIINIQVQNPRTHLKKIWMSYTDYEIRITTKNKAFVNQQSIVRRRFSEVAWLKKTLQKNSSVTMCLPPFPSKKVFANRFSYEFIEKRRASLEQFLKRLVNSTTYLSEAALHLFLQTNLSVKEIERILDGKDCRDITDFIKQDYTALTPVILRRKSTPHTNADSGFSGSTNLDLNSPECMGNGWSSGCANSPRKKKLYKGRCSACRRKSLCQGASVLPTGQLLAPAENQANDEESQTSSERCREENCRKCNQYDADDETDSHVLDYDVINVKTLRLRNWLCTLKPFSDTEIVSSEDEGESETRTIPEYDVISIPCLSSSTRSMLVKEISPVALNNVDSNEGEQSDDSEYSVVHSTLGGLELGISKELYDSSSTLDSAGIFQTYDVVEMVEVQ